MTFCKELEHEHYTYMFFASWSKDTFSNHFCEQIKVANEIIRADALADLQNGGVAIYFPSHLLRFFRQKNVIHLNSKVANEMIRADQYNGTSQAKCIFDKNGCFTRPLVHNASNWGSDGFLRVKNLKVLKFVYFEIIEML